MVASIGLPVHAGQQTRLPTTADGRRYCAKKRRVRAQMKSARFRTTAANQSAPNFNRKHSPSDFIRCSGLRSYLRRAHRHRPASDISCLRAPASVLASAWPFDCKWSGAGALAPNTIEPDGRGFSGRGRAPTEILGGFQCTARPSTALFQEFFDAGHIFSSHRHRSLIRQVGQRGCRAVQT